MILLLLCVGVVVSIPTDLIMCMAAGESTFADLNMKLQPNQTSGLFRNLLDSECRVAVVLEVKSFSVVSVLNGGTDAGGSVGVRDSATHGRNLNRQPLGLKSTRVKERLMLIE
jgi:hypothetical protein